MKLISWNVNGIRAALKKGFMDYVQAEEPDILCLQETKAQPDQVELDLQGGLYIVYSIDLNKAVDDKASELKRDIEAKLRNAGSQPPGT